jgi:hypothetical protein
LVKPSVRPSPRIFHHLDRDVLGLGLLFGQSGPGDFRIGEHDGRNRLWMESSRFAQQGLDRYLALMSRLVREHGLAGHVANGRDVGVGRLLAIVGDDEATLVELDFGILQTQARAVGAPTDGHQHAAEAFSATTIGILKYHINSIFGHRQRSHFRFQIDAGKDLLQTIGQRLDQVAIHQRQ